jgi:predicted RNA-binding Zn-ribbon protein involved in translation (DUF1610 family)
MKISDIFTCQKCGGHEIEEVVIGVTISSLVENVYDDGDIEYGPSENDGGEMDRYQCANCGKEIIDGMIGIKDVDQLYEYLMNLKNGKEN